MFCCTFLASHISRCILVYTDRRYVEQTYTIHELLSPLVFYFFLTPLSQQSATFQEKIVQGGKWWNPVLVVKEWLLLRVRGNELCLIRCIQGETKRVKIPMDMATFNEAPTKRVASARLPSEAYLLLLW